MNSNEKSFYSHSLIIAYFSVRLCSRYAVYKKEKPYLYWEDIDGLKGGKKYGTI